MASLQGTTVNNFLRTLEQVRATGWYGVPTGSSYTGLGAELGVSSGEGYLLCYNRDTSAYGVLNLVGSATSSIRLTGSIVNVNNGALQQGGNQVLHAGNYTSYPDATKLPLSGGTLTGELSISTGASTGIRVNSPAGNQGFWLRVGYDTDGTATPVTSLLNTMFQSSGASAGTFTFVCGNTKVASISGSAINSLVALQQNGNQVLHAGNYTSYPDATKLPLAGGTMTGTITGVSDATLSFNGGTCTAASYNYVLGGANDGGNKLVIFINGSTRTADGGVNALTIRNDGGTFVLGQASYFTSILGSTVALTGNTTVTGQLNINHSTPTSVLRLYSGGSTIWSLGVGDASGSYFNITADFGSFTINKTNGYVGIGTTSQVARIQLGSGTPTSATDGIQFGGDTSARLYRTGSGIITCPGTIAATFSGNLTGNVTGTASGNLTSSSTLTAGNLSGTIPSGVLGNSTVYIGTTAIALNRSSSSQSLTGISIDGNAATATYAPNRTDATAYPVLWGSGTTTTQTYSCAAVTIQSSTGTLFATTFSGSGASLTSLPAGNLSGTIPSAVLGNSVHFIGTTSIALNRSSASQSLTGISIDGTASNVTGIVLAANGGTGVSTANVNTFFAGPSTGSAAAPSFRTITTADIPSNIGLTTPVINNIKIGYTTTATSGGTTVLTVASNYYQRFTGTTTHTISLPTTSTLVAGMSYIIENNSTGNLTVNSSGGNLVITVIPGVAVNCLCVGTTLLTAADWDVEYNEFASITGTGSVVLSSSPTLVSPALGTPASGNLANCTFPTLNQNTIGTAANVTGVVLIANGGTGQNTAQLGINALAGAVTSGQYLRGNGTNVVMSAIQAADVPTLNQNTTGTAINLSTNRTNWSTNGTITAVVGQLSWKHYGNNHTIFDASNSTDPNGGAVNSTNSAVAWSATYPTLMGWNGASTYGVRVDSCRLADSATSTVGNAGSVTYLPGRTDAAAYPVVWGAAYTNTIGTIAYSCAAVTIQSSTGTLAATSFSGAGTGLTGTASSLSIGGSSGSVTALGVKTGALDANIVTFAKMQQVTGPVAIGRVTASLGDMTTLSGANLATIIGANTITNATNATNATTASTANALNTGNAYTIAGLTSNGQISVVPALSGGYSSFFKLSYDNIATADYTIRRNATTGFLEFDGNQAGYVGFVFNSGVVYSGTSGTSAGAYYFNSTGHGVRRISGTNDVYLFTTSGTLYLGTTGSSSQQIIINNSGNLGVGTSPSSYKLDVNGSCHATSFPASSDARFKKNIKPLLNCVDKVKKMQGVSYEWNEFINHRRDGYSLNTAVLGVIAQDLEKIVPEVVSKWHLSDDCKDARAVDYIRIIPILIEAIKEQQVELDDLKNRLFKLESK